jgi:5-formyltetrahydrofolate cyclo-ligase
MKHKIRKEMLERRLCLSPQEVERCSRQVMNKFFSLHFINEADWISIYYPTKNEIDTNRMISHALKTEKNIAIPCIDQKSNKMILSKLKNTEDLVPGPYKVLQLPKEKHKLIPISNIGIIVMPALAVDQFGTRYGYGSGIYDKLLKDYSNIKICLVYDFQIVDLLEPDEWDLPVDLIISESRIIRVNI